MTHRIKEVKVLENFTISVVFQNGVEKEYDMCQLFPMFPKFREFEKTNGLFEQVRVDVGGLGISWNDELDLSAEDIWEDGIPTGKLHQLDAKTSVGDRLTKARELAGMTQAQLSEATGIYQADISKIERGLANPSLHTLERLAEGMEMRLNIEFIAK